MEKHTTFSFKCRIIRVFDSGFTALLPNEYLIKFQDSEFFRPSFFAEDEVLISMEDVVSTQQEITNQGYIVIYVTIKNFLSNGIQFVSPSAQPKSFFWNYRGFITHEAFESEDIWEHGTLLRIMIKKLDMPFA